MLIGNLVAVGQKVKVTSYGIANGIGKRFVGEIGEVYHTSVNFSPYSESENQVARVKFPSGFYNEASDFLEEVA